ncbi:MAG TPA: hypothetical protein VJ650_09140 [Gemmatimonadaceae bacterium]|nr:hypothetical protein [Gemmatimonadaceae bacterium]
MFRRILGIALVALGLVSLACDDATGPEGVGTDDLKFLQLPPGAPPLVVQTASFWARTDDNREVRMYFRPRPGESDSSEFLRFRVDEGSLARRPNGSTFAAVDSILITLTVVDLQRLIVDFQPSGLRFSQSRPARLKIEYENADHDFDDDGDVDSNDEALEERFSIWRQEIPGAPWFELGTVRRDDIDEIEGDIFGFTNHALAYRSGRQ